MGAACVPNIRVCGEGRGWDSAPVHYILLLYSQSYPLLNITWLHIVFTDVTVPTFTAWHGTCQRRAARKSSWPGGVRYDHGAGRGWRGRGAPAVCSPAAADVCYWFCWVRRTSDSSTTTHSFLHHATKTQQQLNLETVGWPHQQRAHCEGHSLGGGSVRAVRGGWEEVTGGAETGWELVLQKVPSEGS